MRGRAAAAAGLAALTAAGSAAAADATPLLTLSGGMAGLFDAGWRSPEFGVEYRPALRWGPVRPKFGALGNGDGAAYAYGGLAIEMEPAPWLVVTLGTAIGAYYQGGGFDLGDWLEFRSGIEAAWRRPDDSRLGLALYHMSNAGISHRNPGQESLVVSYTWPLGAPQ